MADSRFFITVALDRASYQATIKKFDTISSKADIARMKAAGIGKGFATTKKEADAAAVSANNLGRTLRRIGIPGIAGFKSIESSLKASTIQAIALKNILATTTFPALLTRRYMDFGKLQKSIHSRAPFLRTTPEGFFKRTYPQAEPRPYQAFADKIRQSKELAETNKIRQYSQRYQAYGASVAATQTGAIVTKKRPYQNFAEQINKTKQLASAHRQTLQPAILATGNSYGAATVAANQWLGVQKQVIAGSKKVAATQKSNVAIQKEATKTGKAQAATTRRQYLKDLTERDNLKRKIGKGHLTLGRLGQLQQEALGREMTGLRPGVEKGQYDERVAQRAGRQLDRLKRFEVAKEKQLSQMLTKQSDLEERLSKSREAGSRRFRQEVDKKEKALNRYGRTISQYGKEIDGNTKSNQRFNATGRQMAKNQSFINSNFGKFSIIMSGLAATLFVWQSLVRAVRAVVGVGIDFETAFIRAADSLKLTVAETKNLKQAAIEAGKTGVVKGPDYTELIAGFVEYGYSVRDATDIVNKAIEREAELFENTITGSFKKMGGLFKELARQAFESGGYFNESLEGANRQLEKIADAEGNISTLGRILEGIGRGWFEIQNKVSPILNLWKIELGFIAGILDKISSSNAFKKLADIQKLGIEKSDKPFEYERYVPKQFQQQFQQELGSRVDEPPFIPPLEYEPPFIPTLKQEAGGRFHDATLEDLEKMKKELPSAMKKAAGFFGFMTEKSKELRLKEINMMLESLANLPEFKARPELLDEYKKSLLKMEEFKESAPILNTHKNLFQKLGIVTDTYYKMVSERREEALKQDLIKLGIWNAEYEKATKGATGVAVPPQSAFEIPEGFDIQTAIEQATQKYGLPENALPALIQQESGFDPYAVSSKGALGLTQLMPDTAAELGVDPLNIQENIEGGAKYLKQQLDRWAESGAQLRLAFASYNAGPGAVIEAGGQIPPYEETEDFVKKVIAYMKAQIDIQLRPGTTPRPTTIPGGGAGPGVAQFERDLFPLEKKGLGQYKSDPKFAVEQFFSQKYQADIAPSMKILADYYKDTGKMSEDYYQNELLKLEDNLKVQTEALKSAGITDAEGIAQRIYEREKYLKTLEYIYAEEVGLTKDQATALQKVFEETGFFDERLRKKASLDFQLKMQRILKNFGLKEDEKPEEAIAAGTIKDEGVEIYGIGKAKEALMDFDNLRKRDLEGWQAYYDATKIMSEEHVKSEKERVTKVAAILAASGKMKPEEVAKFTAEQIKNIDNKAVIGKIDAYKMLYNATGQMTAEYYTWEIQQAADAAEKIKEFAGEKAAAEYEARLNAKTRIKKLLGEDDFESGIRARMEQTVLDVKTKAQEAYEIITKLTESSESIISDSLFGVFQGEFDTLDDLFNSIADSFKAMLDRMVADAMAAELGKILFGQLAGGGGAFGGLFGADLGTGGGLLGMGVDFFSGLFGPTPLQLSGPFAKGAAFAESGSLKKFAAGGIVNRPTLFKFSEGTGLMGEAGAEGILPLKRMPSGALRRTTRRRSWLRTT